MKKIKNSHLAIGSALRLTKSAITVGMFAVLSITACSHQSSNLVKDEKTVDRKVAQFVAPRDSTGIGSRVQEQSSNPNASPEEKLATDNLRRICDAGVGERYEGTGTTRKRDKIQRELDVNACVARGLSAYPRGKLAIYRATCLSMGNFAGVAESIENVCTHEFEKLNFPEPAEFDLANDRCNKIKEAFKPGADHIAERYDWARSVDISLWLYYACMGVDL